MVTSYLVEMKFVIAFVSSLLLLGLSQSSLGSGKLTSEKLSANLDVLRLLIQGMEGGNNDESDNMAVNQHRQVPAIVGPLFQLQLLLKDLIATIANLEQSVNTFSSNTGCRCTSSQ